MRNEFRRARVFVAQIACLLSLCLGFAHDARAEGPAPEDHYNLLIEGALPEAVRLHVRIGDSKEALRFSVGDGEVLAGIRLPPGEPALVHLLAEDSTGLARYEGKAEIVAKEGIQAPQIVQLESLRGDRPVELSFASHRLVLDFAAIGEQGETSEIGEIIEIGEKFEWGEKWESGELSTRVTARVYDADGALIAINPGDVKWEIDDPWIREHAMPCKGANGPAPPCIEFGPIKRGYTDATLAACFQGTICDIELFPDPPVWKMVSAGLGQHACALKTDGRAYCWGQGGHGQIGAARVWPACEETFHGDDLGARPWACAPVPMQVECPDGPCKFIDISAGAEHTCAVDDEHNAWCWGGNFIGELGLGFDDTDNKGPTTPQRVLTTQKFTAISAGAHFTCGLTTTHDVYCWGWNRFAVVPDNPNTMLTVPTLVDVPVHAHSIDAGWAHVCARAEQMRLYCWGANTVYGELGSHPLSVTPQCNSCPAFPRLMQHADIPEIASEDIDLASAGTRGTCAHLPMNGRTVCWGERVPPTISTGPLGRLTRGGDAYCSIGLGVTQCAGNGNNGALGDGAFGWQPGGRGPVTPAAPPLDFREISAGGNFTCGIGEDDRVYCWGSNHLGSLGNGQAETPSSVPVRVLVN